MESCDVAGTMGIEHPGCDIAGDAEEADRALLVGFAESDAALCLCDAADLIRHTNARFRRAFFPAFDGRPAEFTETMLAAMAAGTGIRLDSATPDAFARRVRQERHALAGARSFATDMMDGSWWSVTDTKLSNGWMLVVAQEISALKHEEARLRNARDTALAEARTDFLTGAPNRRHGLRRAEAAWKAARAAGADLALALLDIDHFKAINDVYGHDAGDRALVHFTRSVLAALEPEDQFSRLGGDEFLLVRSGSGADALSRALAPILASLPALPLDDAAAPLRLSVSVGVAQARAEDTWPSLMHRADLALYDAKAGGRNRVALAG